MSARQTMEFRLASVKRQLAYVPADDPYHAELIAARDRFEQELCKLTPEVEAKLDAEIKRDLEEELSAAEEAWRDEDEDEEDEDKDEDDDEGGR